MTYTVFYKKYCSPFWRKIERVEADGVLIDPTSNARFDYRWFLLEDKSRLEIPMNDVIFRFTPERFIATKKMMDSQAGQVIPLIK